MWSFQAGKLLEFSPIVVKGTLYFMDKDAMFYALNADKGKVEWKSRSERSTPPRPPTRTGSCSRSP